jgi:hypothetical protein
MLRFSRDSMVEASDRELLTADERPGRFSRRLLREPRNAKLSTDEGNLIV